MYLTKDIKEASKGNRDAQHNIFKKFYGTVHGISMRYADSDEEAKKFTTTIFIKIFKELETEVLNSDFKEWIRSMAINYCCDEIIKRPGTLSGDKEDVAFYNADVSTEAAIEMIRELPSKSRVIFNLMTIDGKSIDEVAKMFGVHKKFVSTQKEWASIEIKRKMSNLVLE